MTFKRLRDLLFKSEYRRQIEALAAQGLKPHVAGEIVWARTPDLSGMVRDFWTAHDCINCDAKYDFFYGGWHPKFCKILPEKS